MLGQKLPRFKHIRADGWLCELVSMNYKDEPFECVHTYLVSIKPGRVRANHYHKKKEEWIALATGKIALHLKSVVSNDNEKIILESQSQTYELIYIPPFVAHAVENICGHEACIVVFSKNPEDKEDTFPYELL